MAQESTDSGRAGFDWGALAARLEQARQAAGERELSAEQRRDILARRARDLARRHRPEDAAGETLDCLEFLLSGERYAVEMRLVSETLPLADYTPLFCTPPFVLGITNLRGRIVSIVDLRRFFELPSVGLSDLNRVIVVTDGAMEFGILADAVVGMTALPTCQLQPPPATCTGIREEFLAGVTADRLALLDLARILADRRIVVHEEIS